MKLITIKLNAKLDERDGLKREAIREFLQRNGFPSGNDNALDSYIYRIGLDSSLPQVPEKPEVKS
jgi:hypothetical protein